MKHQLVQIPLGKLRLRRDQPRLFRLGANTLGIETGTIIRDRDCDLGAGVDGRQAHPPARGLAARNPPRRILQAVVDRVADQMHQRIGEPLDHGLVELGLLTRRDEVDLLAQIVR